MTRKAARQRDRWLRRGFMVVHPRWLLTEAPVSNVTPPRWLHWYRRSRA